MAPTLLKDRRIRWEQLKVNCASMTRSFGCSFFGNLRDDLPKAFFQTFAVLMSPSSFFLTYCSRLPPSTSRLDHLAKHFIAIQCDVVGLFDGLLCHLLAVNVELDFLWRDGDVELQDGRMKRGHH